MTPAPAKYDLMIIPVIIYGEISIGVNGRRNICNI